MSIENQMTGRIGEDLISILCGRAGVTCNKSLRDDYGWDLLLEYPPEPQPKIAIDMRSGHLAASVQVKTTRTATRSVTINLSNALRYAKSNLPTFVVLVVLDGDNVRYFARHVWKPLIGAWLRAEREADANGVTAIHKESVTLTFDGPDIPEKELLSWIRQQIVEVAQPYAATKSDMVRAIGFDDSAGRASISLKLEGPDAFLDWQLGLLPSVEVSRFVFTSERFGISAGKPEIDATNGQLRRGPRPRSACGG